MLTPTIGPADVLYLPRGWLHAADAVGDDVSLHITFGIHAATGLDVLRAAVDLLTVASGSQGADDPYALRRSLPIGDALGGEVATARARQDAARLLEDLADSDVSHATRRRRDRLTRPDPIGPVAHAALIATMDQATEVVRRPRLAVQIVPAANGGLSIEPAVGPALTVGPALADATTEVLSGRVCTAEGLPGETSDVLELLRMMARSGLVVAVGDMNT